MSTTETPPADDVPFQSLYRRFRPQTFAEVRGQDHVTNTLRNAIANNRVSHAYLFSGPRGTGKTSTARILAKALNCTESTTGEPCGHCESCRSIVAGSSFDVHELDAASNNGVEAMRELVQRASLANPGRWKVYIVDEVHMLSTAASNALLKTLEEPPDHVIFVLATTDPQKVLLTIRSRTQHFEFHLLNEDVIESLLSDVAKSAALTLPDGAIDVARRRGKGSARDALSMLDQVATAGVVEDDSDALALAIASIAASDTAGAIGAIDQALHNGRDPYQLAIELVERLRNGFLTLVAPNARSRTDSATFETEAAEAKALGAPRCVRAMEIIGGAIVAMRDAPEPRITLEVALIRLTHPEAEESVDALMDRIERLERRIDQLGSAPVQSAAPVAPTPPAPVAPVPPQSGGAPTPGSRPSLGAFRQNAEAPQAAVSTAPAPAAAATPAAPAPVAAPAPTNDRPMPTHEAIVAAWGDQLLVGLRPKVRAIYQAGRFVGVEGDTAVYALPNDAHITHAEPLRSEVVTVLVAHFGHPVNMRLIAEGPGYKAPQPTDTPDEEVATPAATSPAAPTPSANPDPFPDSSPAASAQAAAAAQAPAPAPAPVPVAGPVSNEVEEETDIHDVVEGGVVDPKLGLSWAEDKLLAAFPGAEEVTP